MNTVAAKPTIIGEIPIPILYIYIHTININYTCKYIPKFPRIRKKYQYVGGTTNIANYKTPTTTVYSLNTSLPLLTGHCYVKNNMCTHYWWHNYLSSVILPISYSSEQCQIPQELYMSRLE